MSSILMRMDFNGGVSAGWLLKTVGESELYICYFEYQGLPCIAVPFYILGQVGMAKGIVRFKDSRPLPPETGPLGVFLLASVCRHFVQNPSYELKWLFLSPISKFRSMVLKFCRDYQVHFCDVGFRDFDSERSIYPNNQNWLQHSEPDAEGFLQWSIVPQPPPPGNAYQANWQPSEWPVVEGFDLGYLDSQIVGRER